MKIRDRFNKIEKWTILLVAVLIGLFMFFGMIAANFAFLLLLQFESGIIFGIIYLVCFLVVSAILIGTALKNMRL